MSHQLVMSFRGLCLHVNKNAPLPENIGHRVAVVDASHGAYRPPWGSLPPHDCFLEARPDVILRFKEQQILPSPQGISLDGVIIRVVNAVTTQKLDVDLNVAPAPGREKGLDAVPRLETYCPGMTLRSDLLEEGPPVRAACFVDIQYGEIRAYDFVQGGVYTTWRVLTDGDPQLQLTDRKGTSVTVTIPSTPECAELADGVPGSLVLHNSTRDLEDKEYDFVLHYLAREGGIPRKLKEGFPHDAPSTDCSATRPNMITTTSCSNSQYP